MWTRDFLAGLWKGFQIVGDPKIKDIIQNLTLSSLQDRLWIWIESLAMLWKDLLQGSSLWPCQALSMSLLVAQLTSDARHSTCQMFRSDSLSNLPVIHPDASCCINPVIFCLKSNSAGDKVSWIRHRDGSDLNLLTVNDLVYTQVRFSHTITVNPFWIHEKSVTLVRSQRPWPNKGLKLWYSFVLCLQWSNTTFSIPLSSLALAFPLLIEGYCQWNWENW